VSFDKLSVPDPIAVGIDAIGLGWLAPVPAAIVQEVIDVAVILNALRALAPAYAHAGKSMTVEDGDRLRHDHQALIAHLDRLRSIVDALDDVAPEQGATLIAEANRLVQEQVVVHERDDEGSIYPRVVKLLRESHSLSAMSRAHREIMHLSRLLARIVEDLPLEKLDRYLLRDAQRAIEAIEALVRIHTAQGRLTGWILCLLPFIMFCLISLTNPGYSAILVHDPAGQKLAYAGICMMAMGGLLVRKIVRIRV